MASLQLNRMHFFHDHLTELTTHHWLKVNKMKAYSNAANIRQADFLSAFNQQHLDSCNVKKIDRYSKEDRSIHKCYLRLIHASYG